MPKTYKRLKEIDIYDLAELTGQSAEELAEGFKQAEEDIKNGRTTDANESIKNIKQKLGFI